MPIQIYWLNQSKLDSSILRGWFGELRNELAGRPEKLPVPHFDTFPADLETSLAIYLERMLPGRPGLDFDDPTPESLRLRQLAEKLVFLFCSTHHPLVRLFQEENQLAHWGIAIPTRYAVAWHPGKHLIWHELLHLLGAKDCYNKFGIDKCPEPQCLMRRAPSPETCGDKLTLCAKNIRRIQRFDLNRRVQEELKSSLQGD